jgi:phosphoglycerate dehydrogenase-like enzyme
MKALFLGVFAARQAAGILGHLETRLEASILPDEKDRARLPVELAEAEIVLATAWGADFPPAPRLRLLQVPLAGTDGIDFAALPPGVVVANAYGHEGAIGEYAIMMMLAWRHRLIEVSQSFREGSWRWSPLLGAPLRRELAGATIGIVGLGGIGREIAWRAAALGCRVVAANRTPREAAGVERSYPLGDLDRMLGQCDVVAVSVALTAETTGLIDARRLAAMKREAFLINLARGPILDEDALYEALKEGVIAGAALDVWWRYPSEEAPDRRPSRHPFHELPNVLMTPHSSPWTEETFARRSRNIARNLDRYVRGETLENVVSATLWE